MTHSNPSKIFLYEGKQPSKAFGFGCSSVSFPNQAVLVQMNKGLTFDSGNCVMMNIMDSSSDERFPFHSTGHKKCMYQTGQEVPVTGWRFSWTVILCQKSKNTCLVLVQFWIRFNRLENNSSSSIPIQVRMDSSEGFWFKFGPTARFQSLEGTFPVLTSPFWLTEGAGTDF